MPVGWRGQLCRAPPRHPQGGLPGGRRGASPPARLRGSLARSVSSLLARGALGALGPGGVGEGLQACFSNTARAHRQLPAAPPFLPPPFRAGTATEGQPGASLMEEPGWGGHRGPWEAGGERLPRAPLLRPGTASGPQQAWGRPGSKRARRWPTLAAAAPARAPLGARPWVLRRGRAPHCHGRGRSPMETINRTVMGTPDVRAQPAGQPSRPTRPLSGTAPPNTDTRPPGNPPVHRGSEHCQPPPTLPPGHPATGTRTGPSHRCSSRAQWVGPPGEGPGRSAVHPPHPRALNTPWPSTQHKCQPGRVSHRGPLHQIEAGLALQGFSSCGLILGEPLSRTPLEKRAKVEQR